MTAHDRLLLVEDNPDITVLLSQVLYAHGFDVRAARNGRVGFELLRSWSPDVVVLDLMMPELDGFGFLAEYRGTPPPRPPVVAMSPFERYLPAALASGGTTST